MPAPTVLLVMRSIRMNPPRSRFSRVRLEDDRPIELEPAHADVVQFELARGDVLERVDVELVLERRDRRRDRLGADLQAIRAPLQHRPLVHPDDGRLELVGHLRRRDPAATARRRGWHRLRRPG